MLVVISYLTETSIGIKHSIGLSGRIDYINLKLLHSVFYAKIGGAVSNIGKAQQVIYDLKLELENIQGGACSTYMQVIPLQP